MARAIWKGSLAFGLVNIPVELFSAVRDHRPRFRLLHARDQAPIRYERVCRTEGKPVAWEDLVKGYEYEKGRYVVLTKDDFRTAALQKTKTVDILDFVDAGEIDERYFETPYYVQPGKGADRSYALLREAIRDSGRIGIGKIILREAQHLAAIEVIGEAIVLTMMRFADELADLADFEFPSADGVRKPELAIARQLVESLSAKWDPSKYTDEYRDNLMRVIKGKLKGREPRLKEREAARQADVVDLMSRLKASLEQRGGRETSRRGAASKGKGRSAAGRPGKRSAARGRRRARKTRRAA